MKQPHLLCDEKDIYEYVILVGDPARVDRVANQMEEVEHIAFNREFKLIKGSYKGTKLNVVSTGIGGASAAIAIEELFACGTKAMIRVGSAGAYQNDIGLGELIISSASVRDDGASASYIPKSYPAVSDVFLTAQIADVAEEIGYTCHVGITRSHDSFYTKKENDIMDFWNEANVLGADMETGILFTLGNLKGFKAASILNNVVLYQGDLKESISNYADEEDIMAQGEKSAIHLALEALYSLDNQEK